MSRAAPGFLEKSSYLRHYLWKYRKPVAVGLSALIAVDLLEILPPIFLKRAVDAAVASRPLRELATIALAYFGVALFQGVCRYVWRMYLIRSSMFAGRDLRNRFADHLFGLGASFFDRNRIGDLMSLATSDVEAVRMALGAGLLTLADALVYLCSVPVAMYLLSPRLTLLAFLPLPLIPWFVVKTQREVHARFEKVQEAFARLAANAQENLNGIRVVKAFAREAEQIRKFSDAGREFVGLNLHLARVQSSIGPILDFMMSLGLVILLWFGGRHVVAGAVTLGTFVAFQRYIQKMVWPMTAVGLAITHYQRAIASSGRLDDVFGQGTDVRDPGPGLAAMPRPATRGRVELRKLVFRYPLATKPALEGISLVIDPGERVAFVGEVGAGKSALLGILPRLYPCPDGQAFLDGIDINRWSLAELRSQIGYVGQDVFLFSESVLENIAYGLREGMARADGAIERFARMASVHGEIERFSAGYGTRLGERGVNLSGGQKQRLTIARALAREPSVLALDDALSAVDVQTEERILAGLRSRPGRNTELIAAHRISTVKDADRIVVLHRGKIAESGTHAELAARAEGLYRRFYDQQRLKEDLEAYASALERPAPEAWGGPAP